MPPAAEPAEADPADPPRLRIRDALALGVLHGPAELLPISSSAHVALVPWLLNWPYARLPGETRKAFEVALHAGTVAALLVGLRGEVRDELRALDRRRLQVLALSTLPPGVAGLLFERVVERRLGTPASIAAGLAAGAVALAAADARGGRARRRDEAGALDGLALGVAQACALVPGVSRSGATLTAARARGFARADASVLSRHVALPVIAGATALKLVRAMRRARIAGGGGEAAAQHGRRTATPPPSAGRGLPDGEGRALAAGIAASFVDGAGRAFAAGIAASFIATLASIRFLRAGHADSLAPFAAYRMAVAALVFGRLRAARTAASTR